MRKLRIIGRTLSLVKTAVAGGWGPTARLALLLLVLGFVGLIALVGAGEVPGLLQQSGGGCVVINT